MARFNQKTKPQTVVNHQDGEGFKLSDELELVSVLATGLDTGKFYEKSSDRELRLWKLIKAVGTKNPELAAKMLVYARSVMGQRSVTHVGSVALAPVLSGTNLGARFFSKRDRKGETGGIVYRLDDMLEIVAYYMLRNPGKPLPNSMKKGFKAALENADSYELAKYQGKGKDISLVDVVNLVHPKPSKEMEKVFKSLMNGTLTQRDTAEDKNTRSGQEVAAKVKSGEITKEEAKKELADRKAENWAELILEGKLGYLALLRNLRNIVNEASDEVFKAGMDMLTDEKRVRKSLVFPHQIDLAFEVLLAEGSIKHGRKTALLTAVNKAYELAIPNLTELFTTGRTAVVFDTSASMQSNGWNGGVRIGKTPISSAPVEKATLIAATLAKGIGADMFHFASGCEKINYNPLDTVNTIKNKGKGMIGNVGHGTAFDEIFRKLKSEGGYDRVFVISDMQGGDSLVNGYNYKEYVRKYGTPYVYSIDIVGYGTTMFKQTNKLINLYGYSADIYEMVKKAEIDPKAILREIEKIVI